MLTRTARMFRILALAVMVGALAVPVLRASPAYACSCMPMTLDESIENADLIAEVTVHQQIGMDDYREIYEVEVREIWKGEQTGRIQLATSSQTTACGLGAIPRGTEMRLWASGENGRYSATWCALPPGSGGPGSVTAALEHWFGQPTPAPAYEPPLSVRALGFILSPGGVVTGVAVVLGLVLGATWLLWRRANRPRPTA